jgi:hypothetical protein
MGHHGHSFLHTLLSGSVIFVHATPLSECSVSPALAATPNLPTLYGVCTGCLYGRPYLQGAKVLLLAFP